MILVSLYTSLFVPFLLFALIIIIHEGFHMLSSLLFKVRPKSIELTALGGIINLPLYKLSPIQKIIVSASGVISNLLILIITYNLKESNGLFIYKELVISYNVSLIIFSLLPIYPLDGYNILCGIIELFSKNNINSSLKINFYSSVITLIGFLVYSILNKGLGLIAIGVYLIYKNVSLFKQRDFIYLQNYQYYLTK